MKLTNIKTLGKTIIVFVFLILSSETYGQSWETLFNGKDLKGWKVIGGTAPYVVQDGMIIGTSKNDKLNTFLCTEKPYSDFILELEIFLPNTLNSGIQFRSNTREEEHGTRLFGYQCEVDPTMQK